MTKVLALLALGALLASPAWGAPEDDELAPLTPVKPRPRPRPKPPARTRPAPAPAHAPGPQVEDELAPLTPVVARGELGVHLVGVVPVGALLLVDGKEMAELPAGRQALPVGEHLVQVKRPGFATFTRKLTLSAGRAFDLEVRLQPVAAVLSVASNVPDAQVLVNGRSLGTPPLFELEVPPGPVEVVLVREGYLDAHQRLVTVAGRDYPVTLQLAPAPLPLQPATPSSPPVAADAPVERVLTPAYSEPGPLAVTQAAVEPTPLVQRWYFWAGVAVVVAAAAAGTAVAVTSSLPPRPRTPGEVCSGVCDGCIGLACAVRGMPALPF